MTAILGLLNPHAQGGRLRHRAPALRQALTAHAPAACWGMPETVDEAQALIRQLPAASRVVALGGDGTVNRWLPALLEGGHTLGLVPLGSGNDLARALGVRGLSCAEALARALTAPASAMDVGVVELQEPRNSRAGGACGPPSAQGIQHPADPPASGSGGSGGSDCGAVPFLSSLATGFDASVGLRALQGPRWLRGQPRYLWATLKELVQLRSWNLDIRGEQIEAGGEEGTHWQGRMLLASTLNTRTYGSGMPAAPDARIDDGRLDLLRAQAMGRAGVLTLLPRLLRGTHLGDPRVALQTVHALQVHAEDPVPLAVDGEYLGAFSRFAVRVLPERLQVVTATMRMT